MMVPWDIYLPTPHAERYYGNASQYADLYKFVRENAELLDATTERIKIKDSTQVLTLYVASALCSPVSESMPPV